MKPFCRRVVRLLKKYMTHNFLADAYISFARWSIALCESELRNHLSLALRNVTYRM